MIRIETVERIPQVVLDNLGAYSAQELSRADTHVAAIERGSAFIGIAFDDEKPLVAFGLMKPTLIGPWTLWLLVCHGYTAEYLTATRKAFRALVAGLGAVQTQIEETFVSGQRFAQILGLRPTQIVFDILGVRHRTYEGIF